MAHNVLLVVSFPSVTTLPRDAVNNTFAFHTDDGSDVVLAEARDAVVAFYADTQVNGSIIGHYINATVTRSVATDVWGYSLDAHLATPTVGLGAPIYHSTFTPVTANSGFQQNEVALAMSFHADLTGIAEHGTGGTRPRARNRGRIFLGPLAGTSTEDVGSGRMRPSSEIMTGLAQAGGVLAANHGTSTHLRWAVWSRKDQVLRTVTGGWVDNEFDTQRRRGGDSTARTTF